MISDVKNKRRELGKSEKRMTRIIETQDIRVKQIKLNTHRYTGVENQQKSTLDLFVHKPGNRWAIWAIHNTLSEKII